MCVGLPGRIVSIRDEGGAPVADVDVAGERRRVRLDFLPDLVVGDYVVAHAGYALTRLTPEEAAETIRVMTEVGLLQPPAADSPGATADAARRDGGGPPGVAP